MKKICGILICIMLFATVLLVSLYVTALGDNISPEWRNQGQNKSTIQPGESISLFAQGRDNVAMDWAWLATNETGEWQNFTGWWDHSWDYYKKITIYHSQVEDDLIDFPLTISYMSSDFADHAQTDGDDFVFVDATNTTQYNHEIEYYNSATGELVAWVNIPFLSSSEDTILYVYYGNPDCGNQENVEGTWNSGYVMIHHMTGDTYEDLDDSTPNHWDVTSEGGDPSYNQAGKIGRCVDFDGDGDYLKTGGFRLPIDSSHTGCAWVYVDGSTGSKRCIFEGDSDYGISLLVWTDERFRNHAHTSEETAYCYSTTTVNVAEPEWIYICTRADAYGDQLDIFVNGVSEAYDDIQGTINPETEGLNIGTSKDNNNKWMDGKIDELRVSSVARSDGWIKTEYNNMVSPSTFSFFGSEQSLVRTYGSPMKMQENSQWQWSNFTWQNQSIPDGTHVGWRIYYMDSSGNTNHTDIMSFTIVEEETVYVDDDADSDWYDARHVRTIQEGIDNATSGYTIYVYSGTYPEEVVVDKTINLTGENKDTTIIDGGGGEDVVRITASGVNISGFTIQNSRCGHPQFPPPSAINIFYDYNTITGNIITNNDYGIILDSSSNNIVTGNNITENDKCGIYLITSIAPPVPSENNHIYHNNFINNYEHALDGFTNSWDDGYPSGGNYWDNYTGVDNNWGPNQNMEGSDGIGDTPYSFIGNGNEDRYPLMNPWNGTLPGFQNDPPYQPEPPDGSNTGHVGIEYTYTANAVTDPNGDDVSCLFDWGDENQSGWTDFVTSGSDVSVSYAWQTENSFDIKVKAKDIHDAESGWSSILTITITSPPLPELVIDSPSFVIEGYSFDIAVTATGIPIEGAIIKFLEETYYTDSDGVVNLTAPLVENNADYFIIASHDDYESAIITITVLNQEEQDDKGWIYGRVSDTSGENIEGASVSVIISDYTTFKIFTDEEGYLIRVPTGTYIVEASKSGYEPSTKNDIVVNKNEATEVNFLLEEIVDYEPQFSVDGNNDIIEAAIDAGVSAEKIGGEIDFELADEGYSIVLYKEELNVEIVSINESGISFKIEAEGLPGTIIALRLFGLDDFSDIIVEYDGESVERIGFTDIFNLFDNDSKAKYTGVLTEGENGSIMYCLIYAPHFSEHEITIYTLEEVVEAVGGITAVILYVAISTIVVFVFLTPMIVNIIRRRMYH